MSDVAIEITNVTKRFRDVYALNNVTISFESGTIHGIIGRNGSGKTVLFKCICGFMAPDSGEIRVRGKLISPRSMIESAGVIVENPRFLPAVNGYRNLQLLAGINKKATAERIRQTILTVGLDPYSKKHVGKYSMGMRQRLGIAQAIMEDPDIIILDEPMNGLDKSGVNDVRKLLLSLKKQGKTILIASHNSEDINVLCDTVCEMDAGILTRIR